jgi:hypothetical protein
MAIPQLSGSPTVTAELPARNTIFISYADNPDKTTVLVDNVLKPFLENLGFKARTFKDARSDASLIDEIGRLIHESYSLIAFLTKDISEAGTEKWHPRGSIPEEIGRALALHHTVILYYEEGVTIPANNKSYYCRSFKNAEKDYTTLLVDLAKALKIHALI